MNTNHDVILSRLDLNLLLALDVLLTTQHVTRAAHRVGVSQSAMSHSLRKLRAIFDDPLLVRSGASMVRTPRADALLVPLRSALVALSRLIAEPTTFDPSTADRAFRMSTPDLFDAAMLPKVLDKLRTQAPRIDLHVRPIVPSGLDDALRTGEIDLAIVPVLTGQIDSGSTELVRRVLLHDSFSCFVHKDHPALVDGALAIEAFCAAAHLLVSPSGFGAGVVDAALADRGLVRRIALRLPTFAAAPRIVAQSDLVLTAPTSMTRLLWGLPVVAVPPPLTLPRHSVCMLWHGRFTQDPGHRWLRELLVSTSDPQTPVDLSPGSTPWRAEGRE